MSGLAACNPPLCCGRRARHCEYRTVNDGFGHRCAVIKSRNPERGVLYVDDETTTSTIRLGRLQPDISLNSFLDLVLNLLLFFVFVTELAMFNSLSVAVPKTE